MYVCNICRLSAVYHRAFSQPDVLQKKCYIDMTFAQLRGKKYMPLSMRRRCSTHKRTAYTGTLFFRFFSAFSIIFLLFFFQQYTTHFFVHNIARTSRIGPDRHQFVAYISKKTCDYCIFAFSLMSVSRCVPFALKLCCFWPSRKPSGQPIFSFTQQDEVKRAEGECRLEVKKILF